MATVKNTSNKIINIGTTPLMPDDSMEVSADIAESPAIKAMAALGQLSISAGKAGKKKAEEEAAAAAKKAAEEQAAKEAEEAARKAAEEQAAAEAKKKAEEEAAAKKAAEKASGKGESGK